MATNDNSLKTKTAVSYIRLSSDQPTITKAIIARHNYSIQEKAEESGAMIVKRFKDIGVSRDAKEKPELQKLLQYIEANRVDYVIVPSFSMLTKHLPIFIEYAEQIKKTEASLVTPSGEEIMLPMLPTIHNLASAQDDLGNSDNKESRYGWPVCKICHRQKAPGGCCQITTVSCNGRFYDRIRAGSESNFNPNMDKRDICDGCGTYSGYYHHWGCYVEICPFCHLQLIGCDCDVEVLMKR